MEFRKVLALRGPNVWANFPVLEVWVDLGDLNETASDGVPGFNERLLRWLPSLIEHRCSLGVRGGFCERLRRGTYPAHILEHLTLELQSLAGTPVGFGRARATAEDGVYRVAIEFEEEVLARASLETARAFFFAALNDLPFDITLELKRLQQLAYEVCLGPSTRAIVKAAHARGIPWIRLSEGSLVQLGQGAKARRILAAETDATSAIAEWIAQDKDRTRTVLNTVGVPVPEGRAVSCAEDAWDAAQALGLPVVVKPRYGNHGRAVALNLHTRAQVEAAYTAAAVESTGVIVERYISGRDYRLLIVGSQLVAATRRNPPQVIGDGQHSVAKLIALLNQDPRRSDGHATALSTVPLDETTRAVLADQGYTQDAVPLAGHCILIRRNANLSTGGTAVDVTDQVHPEVAARAIEAAQAVGLDIAGVDVIAADITQPLETQHGTVIEVNAGPGLRMHLEPTEGSPQPVGEAIVELMFPKGETGRIPLIAVTGTNGKTTTTRLMAHILKTAGHTVGMATTDGLYIDRRRIDPDDCAGPLSAQRVLQNPQVDAAVLETARGGILRAGLGFDRCHVAVVTNIGEGDHLGLADIHTPEQLATVKRTVVDCVLPKGHAVLNADDPLVAAMASYSPGGVIFFARHEGERIRAHRDNGARAVFLQDGLIILAQGHTETPLLAIAQAPLTHGGSIEFQIENVLAATAAAWSLGIPLEAIRQGLESFVNDSQQTPARFNVLKAGGATVIVDYGHNPSALTALTRALEHIPHRRRTIMFTVAGDRRDADIMRQAEIVGTSFDRVVLYEDRCTRGRPDGEVIALIRRGLASGRLVRAIEETRGERAAVELALKTLKPGDLVVIQADTVETTPACVQAILKCRPHEDGMYPKQAGTAIQARSRCVNRKHAMTTPTPALNMPGERP